MLLPLPHFSQKQQADCLVGCTAMVLTYLHIPTNYNRLIRLLGTTAEGTPFSNVTRLQSFGLVVEVNKNGNIALLQKIISTGLPLIVAVQTWALPYWNQANHNHAVVIAGSDVNRIYLHDPAFEEAPQVVSNDEFLAAWGDHDYQYGIIALTELHTK